ncbi:uncharacterized protein LOC141492316 [Macrotis lagotis]|uniref:uncharacterized protein LOC141492316 n=1 Tax=Macrotis lagotis TaxID=92651 RepID=UPI003D6853DF
MEKKFKIWKKGNREPLKISEEMNIMTRLMEHSTAEAIWRRRLSTAIKEEKHTDKLSQNILRRLSQFLPFCSLHNPKFGEGRLPSTIPTLLKRSLKEPLNFNVPPENKSDIKKKSPQLPNHPQKRFYHQPKIVLLPCPSHWIVQSTSLSNQQVQPQDRLRTTNLDLKFKPELLTSPKPWTMEAHSPHIGPYTYDPHHTPQNTATLFAKPATHSGHQPNTPSLFYSDQWSKATSLSLSDHWTAVESLPYLKNPAKPARRRFFKSGAKERVPVVSLPSLKNSSKVKRTPLPKSFVGNTAPTSLLPASRNRASVPHLPQLEHYKETPFCIGNQVKVLSNCHHLPKIPRNSDHKTEHPPRLRHWPIPPIYPCHKIEVPSYSFYSMKTKATVLSPFVNKAKVKAFISPGRDDHTWATTVSSSCLENQSRDTSVTLSPCLFLETQCRSAKVEPPPHSYLFHQDTLSSGSDKKAQSVQKSELPLCFKHCSKFQKYCDQCTQSPMNHSYLKEAILNPNHSIQKVPNKKPTLDLVYLKPFIIEGGNIPLKTVKHIINSIPQDKIIKDLHKQILLRKMRGCSHPKSGPYVSSSYKICLICASWIPSGCIHIKGTRDPHAATLVAIPTPIPGSELEIGIKLIFKTPQKKFYCADKK